MRMARRTANGWIIQRVSWSRIWSAGLPKTRAATNATARAEAIEASDDKGAWVSSVATLRNVNTRVAPPAASAAVLIEIEFWEVVAGAAAEALLRNSVTPCVVDSVRSLP